ncbi:unnamed protein product [Paramecium octaurelia]|uniref:HIT-type domain-containing protein n=1 Tax=Paramecium octaurelia TaxID=43137 RepID=A0A8S1SUH7_PAROT|nr:unnamed protein product [Paramecium octaurelia]
MKQKENNEIDELLILTQKSKLLVPQFKRIQQQCDFCQKQMAKYSCPKCNKMQCSLDCYKTHSETCTSSFQKEHEIQKMKGLKASFEEQIEMKKALNQFYEESKDENIVPMNEEEINERWEELQELCEQGKLNLDQLTLAEQHEFAKFIQEMVIQEPWIPWWEVNDGVFSLYVDELDQNQKTNKEIHQNPYLEFRSTLKQKIQTVVPFNKLCKIQHEDLRNHLFNLIASISIIAKVLDGDIIELNREFYNMFTILSYTMDDNTSLIGNLDLSYKKLKEHAHKVDKGLILPYINREDLIKIFSNKFFVIEILFYAYDAIHSIEHQAQNEDNTDFAEYKKLIKTLNLKKQKLLFYISYALSKNHEFYQQIRTQIKELNE